MCRSSDFDLVQELLSVERRVVLGGQSGDLEVVTGRHRELLASFLI